MRNLCSFLLVILFLTACKEFERQHLTRIVAEWENKQIQTEVDVDKTLVSLGKFSWQEEQKATLGYNSDGSPIIQEVAYPGEYGYCAGSVGNCISYNCTRYY